VRVAIIGGGVMGCASAEALAKRGVEVVLLERAIPGAEASSAAAGILGAQIESHAIPELREMLVTARELYPRWSEELRDATGIDIGYRRTGVMRAHTDAGLRAMELGVTDIAKLEPEVSPDVLGGIHFPDDGQVDPRALLRALVVRIHRLGVTPRTGTTVRSLLIKQDICAGVVLDDGPLEADAVILAAGSWSSLVGGLPAELPAVTPARGQMVLLEERPPRLASIVFGPAGYVVPRGDGRVLCGSTLEHVGFRREVTAGGVHKILASTLALVPHLASAEMAGSWASFRPQPAAGRPLLGRSPMPGLMLATGHHRNGILLAKLSANLVAQAVCDGEASLQ
jgi:glycine oxidase